MLRSGNSRVSKETSLNSLTQSENEYSDHQQHVDLPTYNPLSDIAKKEHIRVRSAEKAIHIIPALLLLCAIFLWFFSNPDEKSMK